MTLLRKTVLVNCLSLVFFIVTIWLVLHWVSLSPKEIMRGKSFVIRLSRADEEHILVESSLHYCQKIARTPLAEMVPQKLVSTRERSGSYQAQNSLTREEIMAIVGSDDFADYRFSDNVEKRKNFESRVIKRIVSKQLERKAKEFAAFDSSEFFQTVELQQIIQEKLRVFLGRSRLYFDPEDCDCLGTVPEKIDCVLRYASYYPRWNFYLGNNMMTRYLVILGEKAVEPLLLQLERSRDDIAGHSSKIRLIEETLSELLDERHRSVILHYFNEYGLFRDLLVRLKLPEAHTLVAEMISKGSWFGTDLAFALDQDYFVPLLLDRIEDISCHSTLVKLATIPDLDLTEQMLRHAAEKFPGTNFYNIELVSLLIENGHRDGFRLLMNISDLNRGFLGPYCEDIIRSSLGIRLRPENIEGFLKKNIDSIHWDGSKWRIR